MSEGWRKPWHVMIGFALIAAFFSFAAFVAYLLYGPGITVVVPDFFGGKAATTTETVEPLPAPPPPTPVASLEGQPGTLFECEAGKTLKAQFGDATVRLALSDGRILTLPQVVTEKGEIRYENTDGSFAFLNTADTVYVEENDAATYASCTTASGN
jgi:hypothetical protein